MYTANRCKAERQAPRASTVTVVVTALLKRVTGWYLHSDAPSLPASPPFRLDRGSEKSRAFVSILALL